MVEGENTLKPADSDAVGLLSFGKGNLGDGMDLPNLSNDRWTNDEEEEEEEEDKTGKKDKSDETDKEKIKAKSTKKPDKLLGNKADDSTDDGWNRDEEEEEEEETKIEKKEKKQTTEGSEGSVTKTKKLSPFVEALHSELKLEFDEEAFFEEYEDSPKGITKFISDLYKESVEASVSRHKEVKQLVDLLESGKTVDDFIKLHANTSDYKGLLSIDPEKADEDTLKKLHRMYYKKTTKLSDAKIDTAIARAEELNALAADAPDFIAELKEIHEQETQQEVDRVKQEKEARQTSVKEFWEGMFQVLDKTEDLKGIKLTPKLKTSIKKHLTEVVTDGDKRGTRYQLNRQKGTKEDIYKRELLAGFYDMIDYDDAKISKITSKKLLTELTDTLNESVNSGAGKRSKADQKEEKTKNNSQGRLQGSINDYLR